MAPIGLHRPPLLPLAPVCPRVSIGPHWPPLAPIGSHWPPLAPVGPHWPPLAPICPHLLFKKSKKHYKTNGFCNVQTKCKFQWDFG